MNQPLVSIIINNYNYGRYLGQAIDSALAQTYPNTEIIVVDDGSTDDSKEIIKSYGDKIIPVLKANGGQASTFNAGFVASRGDISCFLDSDDMFLPTKVAEVVQVFHLYQEIDWCFHPLYSVQTDELETTIYQKITDSKSEPTYIEIDFRNELKAGEQPKFVPQTSALTFSRTILQKILPLPEDQKTYVGDSYLAMAALSLSRGCLHSEKLSFYRLHGSNAYSNSQIAKQRETFARLHIITGYWLRTNYPEIARYTNVFFGKGLACFWLLGKTEERYKKFIKDYFSYLPILEKLGLILRASYYSTKSLLFKVLP